MSAATPPASEARALDRRIVAIAVPALGSLIAEPLYLLVDAAIVGHLGPRELAALGIATQVLLTIVSLCVFLAYGTTTAVARAAEARGRAALGVQAAWLGAITGGVVAVGLLLFAGPLVRGLSGDTPTAAMGARYLQLAAIGVAAQLIAIAGQGWLRGREALGLALKLVVAAQLINVVAELLLVYGLDLGLDGSAIGTVIAQVAMAAATLWLIVRAARSAGASLRPDWGALRGLASFGGLLFVRSASLAGSYLLLSAFAARISDPAMGAHLVATNLLWLGALALDALAIAAQVIVAGALGARDYVAARRAAARVTSLSTGFGILVGALLWLAGPGLVASIFTDDASVAAAAEELWPWLCVIQIIGGVVFALDGILIGAEDGRVLALSMAASAASLLVALTVVGTGSLDALWAALTVLSLMRTGPLAVRIVRGPLREPAAA